MPNSEKYAYAVVLKELIFSFLIYKSKVDIYVNLILDIFLTPIEKLKIQNAMTDEGKG